MIESAKLAFADREAWYGDPDFADVPLAGLLDPGYAAQRRQLIQDRASLEHRPGTVNGRPPVLPGWVNRSVRDRERSRPAGDAAVLAPGRIVEHAQHVSQCIDFAQRREHGGIFCAIFYHAADVHVLDRGVGDLFRIVQFC